MSLSGEEWAEIIKAHNFKYKFKGLAGWHKDVREACVADKQFMSDWMEAERKSTEEGLAEELKAPPPKEGQEDDCLIESYAEFLRGKRWHDWEEPENMNLAPARKVIEKLELKEPIRSMYGWTSADSLRFDWSCEYCDAQEQWDYIRQDEPQYYLKDHPPDRILEENQELCDGVDVDDVYAICPGCGGIVLEADVQSGLFVCPICHYGSATVPLEVFVLNEGIVTHPFQEQITNVEENVGEVA